MMPMRRSGRRARETLGCLSLKLLIHLYQTVPWGLSRVVRVPALTKLTGTSQGVRGPESVEIWVTNLRCGEAEGAWLETLNSFVIKMETTLEGRDSTPGEGQEEGDGMKDSDSRDS